MSDQLYSTRLRFVGDRGIARLHGRQQLLTEAPTMPGDRITGVDYIPEAAVYRIQTLGNGWRDMWPHEIAWADGVLRGIEP